MMEAEAVKHIDLAMNLHAEQNEGKAEGLAEERRHKARPYAVTGPPGSGKTRRAKNLIRYTCAKGGQVLLTSPTGQMQSRLRAELQEEGLHVDVDTCHGAFALHKRSQDALVVVEHYDLLIVDEFPQLSAEHFDRIIQVWNNAGKIPYLLFLGDFYQLTSIAGTNAKNSGFWKTVKKVSFDTCHRSADWLLLRKLKALRKSVPRKTMRNAILRGHKAWSHPGPPTTQELRKLYRDMDQAGKRTTIVTCTKRAAQQVNALSAEVLLGTRRVLVELPADYEANPANFASNGKLLKDKKPQPSRLEIKKGMRLHLTKNVDKACDFVNGMEAEVRSWDAASRCLRVKTVTGKDIAIFQYTDPSPEAQNCSYFPIRLGYASTIYKMQGTELDHVTIVLDRPEQKAAA